MCQTTPRDAKVTAAKIVITATGKFFCKFFLKTIIYSLLQCEKQSLDEKKDDEHSCNQFQIKRRETSKKRRF
jgi:hypothetical protein